MHHFDFMHKYHIVNRIQTDLNIFKPLDTATFNLRVVLFGTGGRHDYNRSPFIFSLPDNRTRTYSNKAATFVLKTKTVDTTHINTITSNVLSYHNHTASYLFSVFPEDISPCRLPFMLKAIQDIVL
jgi:hypothetical protein